MFWLFQHLAQDISLIVTVAYIVSRTRWFKRAWRNPKTIREQLALILVFGGIGIFGTYTGVYVKGALANSRVVGVAVGGLLGGPLIGGGAGLLAGTHRLLLGGFTGWACGIATFLEGTVAGLIGQRVALRGLTWRTCLLLGMADEVLQMLIILLLARPFSAAWDLVRTIGMPMIVLNGVGIAIFAGIVQSSAAEAERSGAVQAQKALQIASRTLPILRHGLTAERAREVARIIYEQTDLTAVALTDREKILAHIGAGADHHQVGHAIRTRATRQAIAHGELTLAPTPSDIGCSVQNCPLASALVVPLRRGGHVIGSLKIYRDKPGGMSPVDWEFGAGLGMLFSTQLELAALEERSRLVSKAELRALQAQINPHFLFNALNTIVAFCRIDPEKARHLLLQLSELFRKNLRNGDKLVTLRQELEHVRAYAAIEQARFGDRLIVVEKIAPGTAECLLPGLTLQPLVENAIKHGIYPRKEGGTVTIEAAADGNVLEVQIKDNGVGMPAKRLSRLRTGAQVPTSGAGIGLQNVAQRLEYTYAGQAALLLDSEENAGTTVTLRIPCSHPRPQVTKEQLTK